MKYILFLFFIYASQLKAQPLSFSKIMTYFRTQDPDLIKNDLKQKKYTVLKERAADTKYFDTEIDFLKSLDGQYMTTTGMTIMKNKGIMVALVYFTFNKSDINKRLQEIRDRGFNLITEDSITQSIYQKGDTLVTYEVKDIDVNNKNVTRYEVGVVVNPEYNTSSPKTTNLFKSKNHYSLELPEGWVQLTSKQIEDQKKAAIEATKSESIRTLDIESIAYDGDSYENLDNSPKMYLIFHKQKEIKEKGFSEAAKVLLSDMVFGRAYKELGTLFPNQSFNLTPTEPYTHSPSRFVMYTTKTKYEDNSVTLTLSCNYLLNDGIVTINFYINEGDITKYSDIIQKTVLSFEVEQGYRLVKD